MLLEQNIWPKGMPHLERPEQISLSADVVLVAAIVLAEAPTDHEAVSLLDRYELSRVQAFRHDADRLRYIAAHAALRRILSAVLDGNPQNIGFGRGEQGKPFIARGVKIPGYFNLSHTNEVALVAICTNYEVGIDVEMIRNIPDAAELAALQFSTRENATLAGLPEIEKLTGFYHCWTQREALLKLFGWGLIAAPAGIEIEADPRNPPRALALPGPAIPPRMFALPGISEHLGCVAVPPEINQVMCLQW